MKKRLTLFETLIAASLAALLFSHLIHSYITMSKIGALYTEKKAYVMHHADIHTALKNAYSGKDAAFDDDFLSLQGTTLYLNEAPFIEGVEAFSISKYYIEKGRIFKEKEWKSDHDLYALTIQINDASYPIFCSKKSERFATCK